MRSLHGHEVLSYADINKIRCQDGGQAVGFAERDLYNLAIEMGRPVPPSMLSKALAGRWHVA